MGQPQLNTWMREAKRSYVCWMDHKVNFPMELQECAKDPKKKKSVLGFRLTEKNQLL